MKRVIIAHGLSGRPDKGWMLWLARELQQRGYQVIPMVFPSPRRPEGEAWVEALAEAVGKPDRDTVIVAHSLGTAVSLRYLTGVKGNPHLGGLVLVGGFGDYPTLKASKLLNAPIDYAKIVAMTPHRTVIYSDNDRVVPPKFSKKLAKDLQATEILEPGRGHFTHVERVMELPSALDAVLACYRRPWWQRVFGVR